MLKIVINLFEAFSLSHFVKNDNARLSNLFKSIICINFGNLKNLNIFKYFNNEFSDDIKNSNGIIDKISIKNHLFI